MNRTWANGNVRREDTLLFATDMLRFATVMLQLAVDTLRFVVDPLRFTVYALRFVDAMERLRLAGSPEYVEVYAWHRSVALS